MCLHGIGRPGRKLETGDPEYWLSESLLAEVLDAIRGRPNIRITFDDGNASDVERVLPALLARGMIAEFFILTDRLDHAGSLSVGGVREIAAAGMHVGSHGAAHRPWRQLKDTELDAELAKPSQILSELVGAPVRSAACPFGSYDRRILNALRRYGYERVYTVDGSFARANAWLQPRNTLRHDHSPEVIERLLTPKRGTSAVRRGEGLCKRWR